jgi:hypothetical protein
VPAYRVYEAETGSAILTGDMAKLDDANTTGHYSEEITLSAANGFEVGKSYNIYITAAVSGVTGATQRHFYIEAAPALASVLGTPAGASIAADIAEIEGQTDDIGAAGAGLTALATAAALTALDGKVGTITNLGSGATIGANLVDIEGQTDDIGVAGAGLTVLATAANLSTLASRVGSPSNLGSGASVAANLVDIEAQTDDIGVAGAGLTAIVWNAAWDAEVQSEVQDALEANNLDHVAGTATGIPAIPAGTYLDQMMDDGTATFDRTTDSLQAIKDGGLSLAAGAISSATFASGAITADAIAADAIGASELAADAVAEIADAAWDEALAEHLSAGSTGAALSAAGTAGDPWTTALPGAYGAGTAGNIIGNLEDDVVAGVEDAVEAAIAGLSSVPSVTVISTVAGATATVYQYDTWDATFTLSGTPGLTDYENVIFSVKRNSGKLDAESILYVDSVAVTGGLKYIGEAAASALDKGSLTINSATQFTVYVDREEVRDKIAAGFAGTHTWTLKGIETGSTPDEAITIATGTWTILPGWVRSIA